MTEQCGWMHRLRIGGLVGLSAVALLAACGPDVNGEEGAEPLAAVPEPGDDAVVLEAPGDPAAATSNKALAPKDLGSFGGNFNQPADVNAHGTVVGLSTKKNSDVVPFIYEKGKLRELTEITRLGEPRAINDAGHIVGRLTEFVPDVAASRAVLLKGKTLTKLEGKQAVANDINEKGQIVGEDDFQAVAWDGVKQRRLSNPRGAIQSIAHAINDHGQIVGTANFKGIEKAVIWTDGNPRVLGTLGGASSQGLSINNRGDVVGTSENAAGALRGFLWQAGKFTDLGEFLPDDIDNQGRIVGVNQAGKAFVWQGGQLTELANVKRAGGSSITNAIGDAGHIVGESFLRSGVSRAVLWKL